jgi:hypothetical protein
MREPQDWPVFTMDRKRYSFFDCSCGPQGCRGSKCLYCQWMKEECPADEQANQDLPSDS